MPGLLRRVADAAVGHVVLLTSRCVIGGQPDNAITRMWLDSEAAVRESGVPWTFLHPSGYQSNALRWLPQLREGDVVRAPWPEVPRRRRSTPPTSPPSPPRCSLIRRATPAAPTSSAAPRPSPPASRSTILARGAGAPAALRGGLRRGARRRRWPAPLRSPSSTRSSASTPTASSTTPGSSAPSSQLTRARAAHLRALGRAITQAPSPQIRSPLRMSTGPIVDEGSDCIVIRRKGTNPWTIARPPTGG